MGQNRPRPIKNININFFFGKKLRLKFLIVSFEKIKTRVSEQKQHNKTSKN